LMTAFGRISEGCSLLVTNDGNFINNANEILSDFLSEEDLKKFRVCRPNEVEKNLKEMGYE